MIFSKSISIALGLALLTGCSSSKDDEKKIGETIGVVEDINKGIPNVSVKEISGKAIDGYLVYATVCLDLNLDNYCQIGEEPATSTDEEGSYKLELDNNQLENINLELAPLLVYGGYDNDTKKDFEGKLKAVYEDDVTSFNITPVTTLVESMVSSGEDVEKAKEQVAELLEINVEELSQDPIIEFEKDKVKGKKLLKANLKIQKMVEILGDAESKLNNKEEKISDINDRIFKSIGKKVKKIVVERKEDVKNQNKDKLEEDLLVQLFEETATSGEFNENVAEVVEIAKILNNQIEEVFEIEEVDGEGFALLIDEQKEEIEKVIEEIKEVSEIENKNKGNGNKENGKEDSTEKIKINKSDFINRLKEKELELKEKVKKEKTEGNIEDKLTTLSIKNMLINEGIEVTDTIVEDILKIKGVSKNTNINGLVKILENNPNQKHVFEVLTKKVEKLEKEKDKIKEIVEERKEQIEEIREDRKEDSTEIREERKEKVEEIKEEVKEILKDEDLTREEKKEIILESNEKIKEVLGETKEDLEEIREEAKEDREEVNEDFKTDIEEVVEIVKENPIVEETVEEEIIEEPVEVSTLSYTFERFEDPNDPNRMKTKFYFNYPILDISLNGLSLLTKGTNTAPRRHDETIFVTKSDVILKFFREYINDKPEVYANMNLDAPSLLLLNRQSLEIAYKPNLFFQYDYTTMSLLDEVVIDAGEHGKIYGKDFHFPSNINPLPRPIPEPIPEENNETSENNDTTVTTEVVETEVIETTPLVAYSSCSSYIKEDKTLLGKNGIYTIALDNQNVPVYCDMTREGGGWTLVMKAHHERSHNIYDRWYVRINEVLNRTPEPDLLDEIAIPSENKIVLKRLPYFTQVMGVITDDTYAISDNFNATALQDSWANRYRSETDNTFKPGITIGGSTTKVEEVVGNSIGKTIDSRRINILSDYKGFVIADNDAKVNSNINVSPIISGIYFGIDKHNGIPSKVVFSVDPENPLLVDTSSKNFRMFVRDYIPEPTAPEETNTTIPSEPTNPTEGNTTVPSTPTTPTTPTTEGNTTVPSTPTTETNTTVSNDSNTTTN
jgi:hypothetical protein